MGSVKDRLGGLAAVQRARERLAPAPGSGRGQLGVSVAPVSERFGQDRGLPVDRWYIERFLQQHRADVRGRVLELYEDTYTRRYGGALVTGNDVLHAVPGNPAATLVGDLQTGDGIPADAYDCFVCTQTLQYCFDLPAAVAGTRRALKPGGVLLCTVPGISAISVVDRAETGEFWRFAPDALIRLFGDAYGPAQVTVRAHGTALAASAFLYGLAAEELTEDELAADDPAYPLLLTVRAMR